MRAACAAHEADAAPVPAEGATRGIFGAEGTSGAAAGDGRGAAGAGEAPAGEALLEVAARQPAPAAAARAWPLSAVDLYASTKDPTRPGEAARRARAERTAGYAARGEARAHVHVGYDAAAGAYYFWDAGAQDAAWERPSRDGIFDGGEGEAEGLGAALKALAGSLSAESAAQVPAAAGGDEARAERPPPPNTHTRFDVDDASMSEDKQGDGEIEEVEEIQAEGAGAESAKGGSSKKAKKPDIGDLFVLDEKSQRDPRYTRGVFTVDWGALGLADEEEQDQERAAAAIKATEAAAYELPSEHADKYWAQRYRLFSRFDQGVRLDAEGWFSVTPEVLAQHHAARLAAGLPRGGDGLCAGVALDVFCGVGGNAAQLARAFARVVAVDLDPKRLEMARRNCEVYGVADRVQFVLADARDYLRSEECERLRPDVVFLSPPWGGPDYLAADEYDAESTLVPEAGSALMARALAAAPRAALFLPRTTSRRSVDAARVAALSAGCADFEEEWEFLNKKLKALTLFAGVPALGEVEAALASAEAA